MGGSLKRMRSIKVFISGIIIMMGFLAVATLFLPSKVTVSKSILINAAGPNIMNEIGSFDNWKNWYPAFQSQKVHITISKKDDSSFVTLADENQRKLSMAMARPGAGNIDISLFYGSENNVTYQFILSAAKAGQTQLTWNVNTKFPWYPWKKIKGIFLDKVTGPQYQEILQNLKTAVEMHQAGSMR